MKVDTGKKVISYLYWNFGLIWISKIAKPDDVVEVPKNSEQFNHSQKTVKIVYES